MIDVNVCCCLVKPKVLPTMMSNELNATYSRMRNFSSSINLKDFVEMMSGLSLPMEKRDLFYEQAITESTESNF